MSRLAAALGRRRQLPAWLGPTPQGVPRRALIAIAVLYVAALITAIVTRLDIARVLPLPAANFIVIYVLSMAAAARLLQPPASYLAVIALVTCAAVLVFLGPVLLWPAAIGAVALLYQQRQRAPERP
jgi:amino acid efflux transporter